MQKNRKLIKNAEKFIKFHLNHYQKPKIQNRVNYKRTEICAPFPSKNCRSVFNFFFQHQEAPLNRYWWWLAVLKIIIFSGWNIHFFMLIMSQLSVTASLEYIYSWILTQSWENFIFSNEKFASFIVSHPDCIDFCK